MLFVWVTFASSNRVRVALTQKNEDITQHHGPRNILVLQVFGDLRAANEFAFAFGADHSFPVVPLYDCYGCQKEEPEYYMVKDDVWEQAATFGRFGMLCFDCLADRLGRKLTLNDFTDAPVNDWVFDLFQQRRCYFISGHLDLTQKEFATYYAPLIDLAIKEGSRFILGDARGADAMAQQYLRDKGVSEDRVRVYHIHETPRNNAGWPTLGGFGSDEQRDATMTYDSHRDIAWVRPGREKSGTAKNLRRRET